MSRHEIVRQGDRIAKVLARAGLCSRREAERWVDAGRIAVNGKTLDSPAFNVLETDDVTVDGRPLPKADVTRLWRYHKPSGLVTTNKDPEGRRTVFDALPKDLPRVVSIGRLDVNSEGLLLLSNDGSLSRTLELPSTGWLRKYRVRVFGRLGQDDLDRFLDGVTIDGVRYKAEEAIFERQQKGNAWVRIALREGKNREVKRLMESVGCKVNRLIRTSYGPFQLGKLKEGEVEEVPQRVLKDQVGSLTGTSDKNSKDTHVKSSPKKTGSRSKIQTGKSNKRTHPR